MDAMIFSLHVKMSLLFQGLHWAFVLHETISMDWVFTFMGVKEMLEENDCTADDTVLILSISNCTQNPKDRSIVIESLSQVYYSTAENVGEESV